MYHRILVPLDGSALAETAIPHAELLATATGAELILLRVTILRFVPASDGNGCVVQENGDRAEAEEYLAQWRTRLKARGIEASCRLRGGNVAEEIVGYAARAGVDLIVMSTHGRTGPRLWAYGSVAQKVLHAAPCSVLVVRETKGTRGNSGEVGGTQGN